MNELYKLVNLFPHLNRNGSLVDCEYCEMRYERTGCYLT